MGFYMNHNKEAKNLTFWTGSEVSQVLTLHVSHPSTKGPERAETLMEKDTAAAADPADPAPAAPSADTAGQGVLGFRV